MKEKEKKLQEKYIQFQALQQQAEQISKYLEELDLKLFEFKKTKQALKDLEKTPSDTEILAPISPGIFVKAALKDNKELTTNIGANTAAKKTIPQILDLLNKQTTALAHTQAQLNFNLEDLNQKITLLVQEIQELS